jgi:hypothetical protein
MQFMQTLGTKTIFYTSIFLIFEKKLREEKIMLVGAQFNF